MSKALRFSQQGGSGVLRLETMSPPVPGKGEVVLRVHAVGLNLSDVSLYRAFSALPDVRNYGLGPEGTGTVERLGPGVDAVWMGKRVCTIPTDAVRGYGLLAEHALAPVSALVEAPDGFSDAECSCIWSAHLLGYAALRDAVSIRSGDCAVILSSDVSVKLACLQIAKAEGAVTVTLDREQSNKSELLNWGEDLVLDVTEDASVHRGIEMTRRGGKTVVVADVGYLLPTEIPEHQRSETRTVWLLPVGFHGDPGGDSMKPEHHILHCSLSTITDHPDKLVAATRYIYDRLRFGFLAHSDRSQV